jgi:enoyl-CoA hydratase/carnithine racemase
MTRTRVSLWHGAGDSFCAGNDIEDFLKNLPGSGELPQAGLMNAFVNFDKPVVVAVHGAAIGGAGASDGLRQARATAAVG